MLAGPSANEWIHSAGSRWCGGWVIGPDRGLRLSALYSSKWQASELPQSYGQFIIPVPYLLFHPSANLMQIRTQFVEVELPRPKTANQWPTVFKKRVVGYVGAHLMAPFFERAEAAVER